MTARKENARSSRLHRTPGPIEQGYGACYLLGPLFFRHFRELWAPTFLGQEEYFLSEQLKTVGQKVYYEPRFMVTHQTHATIGRWLNRRAWECARESYQIYKRYAGMSAAERVRFEK